MINNSTSVNALSIIQKVLDHRNELVLDWHKVVRLVDVMEDPDDYYWIFEEFGGKKYYSSCVGKFFILKGNLPDYQDLVNQWNMNVPYWGGEKAV